MTVATTAASRRQHVAWLLVIEGWPYMFVDNVDLAGSGASSWIGESYGARVVKHGLRVPDTLEDALVLDGPQAGLLEQVSTNFEVIDFDGTLVRLFSPQGDEPAATGERLSPADDPAPATIIGANGESLALWDRYVGAEAIGPAGERRYYGGIPGATTPGLDHAAIEKLTGYLAPVEVTVLPRWREGQRAYLYLLRRDPHGIASPEYANWPSWQDQFDGGALVYWGTIARGSAKGRTWSIPCRGRDSFLRKLLNANAPTEWSQIDAQELSLQTGENLIAAAFQGPNNSDDTVLKFGVSLFDAGLDDLPTSGTPEAFVGAIAARLASLKGIAGPDGIYTGQGRDFAFDTDGAHVVVTDVTGPPYKGARVVLIMAEKILRYIGFDPDIQYMNAGEVFDTEYQIFFEKQKKQPVKLNDSEANLPNAGVSWIRATFTSKALGTPNGAFAWQTGAETTNEGKVRHYRPYTSGGIAVLGPNPPYEVRDGMGLDARYIEGQLGRPPIEYLQNGVQVDQTRWFLFRGKRKFNPDEDAVDYYAVAKCSWVNEGGYFPQDLITSQREFVIERWCDARYYGYGFGPMDFEWSVAAANEEGGLFYIPLAALAWKTEGLNHPANVAIGRLLVSSGTASWSAFEGDDDDGGDPTPGSNAFAVTPASKLDDLEIADLGLCIPSQLVSAADIWAVAQWLPGGGHTSPLNLTRYAWTGPRQAEEVLSDLMVCRGLAFSLRGNKYGLFAWHEVLDADAVDVALGRSDIGVDPGVRLHVPEVDLRPVAPVDRLALDYGHEAESGNATAKITDAGRDPGARARQGNQGLEQSGRGLPNVALWQGQAGAPLGFELDWRTLWGKTMATWLASGLVLVRDLPVAPPKSLSLQVGSVVSLTNPWPPSTAGIYGITNVLGRVVRRTLETKTLRARVDLLVQPDVTSNARRFAPIAAVVDDVDTLEERWDADTLTFFCYANYFGREDDASDVAAFVEPAGGTLGGNAKIYGWQYDGVEWSQTFQGFVDTVSTTNHTITLTDAFTGVFYDRRPTLIVLAPYDDQTAAWVLERFLAVTKVSGKFGGSDTQGWRLVP